MKVLDAPQGTDQWLDDRAGILSASNFDKLITTKGEPSKQKEKYIFQLAAECLSGIKEESFQSAAMLKGIETEQEAVDFYELQNSVETKEVGFCLHDSGKFGASPDRLVGEDGLLEIKCPLPSTQIGYLLNGGLDTDYFQQVQGQLLVSGRKWCDLISYSRGLKPVIIRVTRNEAFLEKLEAILVESAIEISAIVEKIKNA